MGMFDEVRSSFSGLNGYYQTKDLDNLMWVYYIDPAGRLWRVDYSGTADIGLESFANGLPRVSYLSNGAKGKVVPLDFTGSIILREMDYNENVFSWEVNFHEGVVQSFFLASKHS